MRIPVLQYLVLFAIPLVAQQVQVRVVPTVRMPGLVDSNVPVWWSGENWFSLASSGASQLATGQIFPWDDGLADRVAVQTAEGRRLWIESVHQDEGGVLYAWYHHEPGDVCDTGITRPDIGALISYDNGATFVDLGIVLDAADSADCAAKNGFFGAGHGDFTVIIDREHKYFYFLFGNYGGDAASQGVAVARMAFDDRNYPIGAVWKYHNGEWTEPGLGGQVTPVWPATRAWQYEDADSFWGPSIHWNTYLEKYVVVMNRACCAPRWPQEGVYLAFIDDLANPASWGTPTRIIAGKDIGSSPGYYTQVVGEEPGETDTLASQEPRLYIKGVSRWVLRFTKD